jgi:hypothetical protein
VPEGHDGGKDVLRDGNDTVKKIIGCEICGIERKELHQPPR